MPIHNRNTIELANLLDDPLSGADEDIKVNNGGKIFSSTKLNEYLCRSYRWLVDEIIARFGVEGAADQVQELIATHGSTMSSGSKAANKDYIRAISLHGSSSLQKYDFITPSEWHKIETDLKVQAVRVFTVLGGNILASQRTNGAMANSGSLGFKMYYMKADRVDATSGAFVAVKTAPDTVLSPRWLNACVHYAAYLACIDKGTTEWLDKAKVFQQSAFADLPSPSPPAQT